MDTIPLKAPPPSKPSALGKREQTKVQNRLLILEAARRVFAELGFGATTVRDIIRATPLASGTFYNYFKSKEEVFQAIRDETALIIRPKLRDERTKAKTIEELSPAPSAPSSSSSSATRRTSTPSAATPTQFASVWTRRR
jgi:AcrR family transcriptional regulator